MLFLPLLPMQRRLVTASWSRAPRSDDVHPRRPRRCRNSRARRRSQLKRHLGRRVPAALAGSGLSLPPLRRTRCCYQNNAVLPWTPGRCRLARCGASDPFSLKHSALDELSPFIARGSADPLAPGSAKLAQIVGDEGAGKSTQVFGWQQRVPGPYRYVPPQPYPSRWERPPVDDLVCADEINRMPVPIPANQ